MYISPQIMLDSNLLSDDSRPRSLLEGLDSPPKQRCDAHRIFGVEPLRR